MIKTLFLIFLVISFGSNSRGYGQCKGLEFEEAVKRKLLSPDLFNTAINSEFMGCPKFSVGDSTLCGVVKTSREEWDISLPDGLIFTALFEPVHYSLCKDVFKDFFFLETIKKIPDPSLEALNWFSERKKYHNTLVSTDNVNQYTDTLDFVQRKMITVLHQIKSWTFCPEKYSTDLFVVHGSFDNSNNIVIYNTACKAEKIYDADIKTMALAYRLFFVCSHELSHAIDKTAGLLMNSSAQREEAEKRANVNGLILTLALSKLVNQMFLEYKEAIEKVPQKATCDEYYVNQLIKKWVKVSDYFSAKISDAKKVFVKGTSSVTVANKEPNWTIWACLEPKAKYTKMN